MQPILIDEIPSEIKEYLNKIYSIRFPRQGYSSDVGLIENNQGFYALKRTKGELFCSWLNREIAVLNCLTNQTKLPVPKVKKFVKQENHRNSQALLEFLEGNTKDGFIWREK